MMIVKDSGSGSIKLGGSQAYTFGYQMLLIILSRTANHGVYLNGSSYMMSFDSLEAYNDKAFTIEMFFRTDKGIYTRAYMVR